MQQRGFTLIELMIGVAIVAILIGIAIPSYQRHIINTRRGDAQTALLGLAQAMERQFTLVGTYNQAAGGTTDITTATAPTIFPSQSPIDGSQKVYNLRIISATKAAYTIRAIPIGGSQRDDGFLELRSSGAKSWDRNNDGTIAEDGSESCWARQC